MRVLPWLFLSACRPEDPPAPATDTTTPGETGTPTADTGSTGHTGLPPTTADTAAPEPACPRVPALAAAAEGDGLTVRFANPAIWEAMQGGALRSATLRVASSGTPAVTRLDAVPAGGPVAGAAPSVEVDVTADLVAWLEGRAPNFGWRVAPATLDAAPELELCVDAPRPPDVVEVAPDGWTFRRRVSGAPFVPAGVNYDHDSSPCPRLLEEYWDAEWPAIEGDFQEMVDLGFDAVRVHLQLPELLGEGGVPDEAALVKLDQLVRLADRTGLLLDVTGLGLYRAEIPAWYAALDDDGKTAAQVTFWTAVASRYPTQAAILSYDLQNEPWIHGGTGGEPVGTPFTSCDPDGAGPAPEQSLTYLHFQALEAQEAWTAWVHARYGNEAALDAAWTDYPVAGETWDRIAFPGWFPSVGRARDHRSFKHDLALEWTTTLAGAVRAVDPNHLVTVGTTAAWPYQDHLSVDAGEWFFYTSYSPLHLKDVLDFVSVHVYPQPYGNRDNHVLSEMIFRGVHVGTPVVLEETYPSIDHDDLEALLQRSRGSLSGWYSFYWGATPAELYAAGDLGSAVHAAWVERYAAFARDVKDDLLVRTPPDATLPARTDELLSSTDARLELYDAFAAARARGVLLDPVLEP